MAQEPQPFERKKIRKKRKPMTPEQKAAAVERLAKAREARAAKNPNKGPANVCKEVSQLPDEHYLSYEKVKGWIKVNQEKLKEARAEERRNVKGAHAEVKSLEGYIRNMNKYLRDGDWADEFYGEDMNNRIKWRCIVPAYDEDGNIKRQHGVYYDDLGYRFGYEDEYEEYGEPEE